MNAVKDFRKHFHGGANRDGNHNYVGAVHAVLKGHHFIGQANCHCCLRRHFIGLNAKDLAGKAPLLEVYRHGPANQAQAYYSYCPHTVLILVNAFSSVGTLAQRDILR